jgi:hypothetical protein
MRLRTTRRIPALALAALALFGQLAGFAHLVAVDHVACEHGELVDVAQPSPALASHHDPDQSFHAATASQGREHEHCLLSPMRRDRAAVALETPRASPFSCDGPTPIAILASDIPAPIPLILLAPKSSPPSV